MPNGSKKIHFAVVLLPIKKVKTQNLFTIINPFLYIYYYYYQFLKSFMENLSQIYGPDELVPTLEEAKLANKEFNLLEKVTTINDYFNAKVSDSGRVSKYVLAPID